jgi:hypothetical protein
MTPSDPLQPPPYDPYSIKYGVGGSRKTKDGRSLPARPPMVCRAEPNEPIDQ